MHDDPKNKVDSVHRRSPRLNGFIKNSGEDTYHLVNQPHHSSFLSVPAGTEISVSLKNCFAERNNIFCWNPSVHGHCFGTPLWTEEATHKDVEPEEVTLLGRHVGKVVDVRVLEQVMGSDHCHIPLARSALHNIGFQFSHSRAHQEVLNARYSYFFQNGFQKTDFQEFQVG